MKDLGATVAAVFTQSEGIRAPADGKRLTIFAGKDVAYGKLLAVIDALKQEDPDVLVALATERPKPPTYPYRCLVMHSPNP